jgi:hypothetical protein
LLVRQCCGAGGANNIELEAEPELFPKLRLRVGTFVKKYFAKPLPVPYVPVQSPDLIIFSFKTVILRKNRILTTRLTGLRTDSRSVLISLRLTKEKMIQLRLITYHMAYHLEKLPASAQKMTQHLAVPAPQH